MTSAHRPLDEAAIEREVRAALARRLGAELVNGLTVTENLFEAGVASIDLVVALAQLERELRIELTQPRPLAEVGTCIAAMVAYLQHNRGPDNGEEAREP